MEIFRLGRVRNSDSQAWRLEKWRSSGLEAGKINFGGPEAWNVGLPTWIAGPK